MRTFFSFVFAIPAFLVLAASARAAAPTTAPAPEPTLAMAEQWWPDLTDYWTPIGWKDHRFRYNIFFDGTILADPSLSQTAAAWKGQGVQIRVAPQLPASRQAYDRRRSSRYELEDDRRCIQGWTADSAPVLWTEWSRDGLLLREHIFAHLAGGGDVKTGTEPLFAWVRLSVHDVCPGLPVPPRYTFCLQLNAPFVTTSMRVRHNIIMHPERATYPRALKASADHYDKSEGLRLTEPDGKVRLVVAPGADVDVQFLPAEGSGKDPLLCLTMDAKVGTFVDLLLPMVPTEPAIVDAELAGGRQKALSESNQFWSRRPESAAVIDVPETYINETLHRFEQFAQVLSERDPETGKNVSLSGSLAYVKVWATPTAKLVAMFLDPLGYHDLAGQYLEPFILAQGTRKPPSSYLEKHPGFLGSPAKFKSIDWMSDHGALLFAIANHALIIDDDKAKQRYVEPIIKACEFIRYARHVKGHPGVQGILPPARYSDARQQTQGVWSDGWNYKGLATAARFLRQIHHPRAQEFTDEAADYKKTFVAAFRQAAAKTATWTDDQGKVRHFIPTSLYGDEDVAARHPFYLDTGPLQLVFAGLMDADDPLMRTALEWFRSGPIQHFARDNSNFMQVGFLRHEMSSCIPGYSWNLYHSHQLGDRYHFLEGMYSLYAGMVSRQTRTICESRGGITGRVTHADLPFYMTRLAVIDDQIADDELHLLRLCPLAWLSKERQTRFEKMPTVFGPVTLRWRLSGDGTRLDVQYKPEFHTPPAGVVFHVPPLPGLTTIRVNGRDHQAAPGGTITLAQ